MGQYERHVFVCTSGETCPTQGDVEAFVKELRGEVARAGLTDDVRINKAGCFSQCGHGPMISRCPWRAVAERAFREMPVKLSSVP